MKSIFRIFFYLATLFIGISCTKKDNTFNDKSLDFLQDSTFIADAFTNILTEPASTDSLIKMAESIAIKNSALKEIFDFFIARHLIQTGRLLEADTIINVVIDQYTGENLQESYSLGKFYNLKAAISAYQHKQENSVHFYQKAIEIFETHHDYRQLAVIQFNLANTFFSRLDFESSYKYILQAKENFEHIGDSTYIPLADGILAVTLTKLQNEEEGKIVAERALSQSIKKSNFLGQILGLYALGEYYQFKNDFHKALEHQELAIQIIKDYKIPNLTLPIQAALLVTYNELNRFEEALEVGKEALTQAKAIDNLEIQYSLYKNLAETLSQLKMDEEAFKHLQNASEIFRVNTVDNNQRTLQTLLIEYETEKKNNLILKHENEIANQRTYILILFACVFIVGLIFFGYRRNLMQQRKIEIRNRALHIAQALAQGEESERMRLANELHDGIASNLIGIKLQLETAQEYPEKKLHLDLVKTTHKEVRRIAHNLMPIDFSKQNLASAMESFCNNLKHSNLELVFSASGKSISLPQDHALILYRCMQEIIQNALKHSEVKTLNVQILEKGKDLNISIEDDGIGFDVENLKHQGIGIFKFEKRLKQIQANLEVDSTINKGTSIFIHYAGG